jgi:DNA-binding response OmpR family regulator
MSKRVLVVDDEPNIVMSLQFLMEREGYLVEVAETGRAAVDALTGTPFDLVLLDVMIPDCDGFEVCQQLRGRPGWAKTKVVMLTAKGRDVEREKGLALGADAYVTKPFSTRDLVKQVKAMLGDA